MPLGEPLVNASYDYLFRFETHPVTNHVTLIVMDTAAFGFFKQERDQAWDRTLHAQLLNKLADDGCSLVVLDSFLRDPRDSAKDEALARAIQRQKHIVLMAEQAEVIHPRLSGAQPVLPAKLFLNTAAASWGVAWLTPDLDSIVRRQWPFPSPGPYPSLPWTAALQAGAKLSNNPQERWLRYYGQRGGWTRMSYQFALSQPKNYFHDQIVFIGTQPKSSVVDGELDKFQTPYTRWTGEVSGGVEILLTSFLNLLNHDWLQRPASGSEFLLFIVSGFLLGGGLCRLRLLAAIAVASGIVLLVTSLTILLSHFTCYWFPWLIIVGGQVPCALAWSVALGSKRFPKPVISVANEPTPETPGYQLIHPPFGEGAYGKVWLARTTDGEWRALKVIYLSNFDNNPDPYEREYSGIKKYQPISDQHPGLLKVDFVSEKMGDYFYYSMELGDALDSNWEDNPSTYKPRDLVNERARLSGHKFPVKECLRIGIVLSEALDFLHRHDMTHRDIKPQNIIFIHGQPKLADLGLITGIRLHDQERTLVGTPGFMPPPPERPGTPQADIYALGMVLYVLSTGRNPALFPDISTTLITGEQADGFLPLNAIILKACQPELAYRYTSASELCAVLRLINSS